jgi:hypothetical protein
MITKKKIDGTELLFQDPSQSSRYQIWMEIEL